ncbi:MAG: pilus assembly protein PilN [Gammaproteobacteria bacterium]|nr:MAG: pilus assembly protein PilN [Gammaproteobacteria bacterium]
MARINLLPWRETRRREQQKEFFTLMGLAGALCAAVVLLTHFEINGRIGHQEKRNQFLTNEIKVLDGRIAEIKKLDSTRQALIERMDVIQNLQAARPGVVHLFDELVKTLPEGVHLSSLKQSANNLQLSGKAESNARVSSYMRKIEDSEWLASPSLEVIETKDTKLSRISSFSLTAQQINPNIEEQDN